MNFTVKRCLMGLVASATMFGIARAQDEQIGTVQLGPKVQAPAATVPQGDVSPPAGTDLPPAPGMSGLPPGPGSVDLVQPGTGAFSNYYRISRVDQILAPRFNVDSRGGGLYGYNAGYSNIGMFVPYKLDDTAILFGSVQGLVTYDGRGGASLGAGWRWWDERIDRVTGLSTWFDFDNGHARPYQQVGFSFESLGRYMDYRVNGYLPVSSPDHVLVSNLTANPVLMGNNIGLTRNNTVEQAFAGFDAEVGGPTPILGRYGLNAYIGGYQFQGMGINGGSFTGVSGRLLSQINEDVSFGVQVTNDHMFGLNTQFQVFANLPNGKPSRWLRNWRVQDKLVAQTMRQNRVIAKTESFTTFDTAINPETHQAYFVANINPNLTTNGNGSVSSPFDSIANYEAVPLAQRQRYDFILVQPRTDGTSTNLDTAGTLELFNGQHLLSTSTTHTFFTENLPGKELTLPISAGTADPILINSSGGNIITLAPGNTRQMEVSGFELLGNASGTLGTLGYVPATGNGIFGNNIVNLNVNNNNIHGTLNGVLVNNLTGNFATNSEGRFVNNNIHDNSATGVAISNNGSPPFVNPLEVLVQGNTFNANGGDGMRLNAQGGSTIGGIIGGPNSAATSTTAAVTRVNTFSNNVGNGLNLLANGGTLNFLSPPPAVVPPVPVAPFGIANNAFGIYNNTFQANGANGLNIATTNDSVANLNIVQNSFVTGTTVSRGQNQYGIGLTSDSGTTNLVIGGAIVTNSDGSTTNPGNTFTFTANSANFSTTDGLAISGINVAVTGTSALSYTIENNTITNLFTANSPPPIDQFTFTFNGVSGTAPFTLANLSNTNVDITSMTWNLASTPATFAANGQFFNPVIVQPGPGDTFLTSVNSVAVATGTSPLTLLGSATPASDANVGLPSNGQLLPLGFANNNFGPGGIFSATSLLRTQTNTSNALTSFDTRGSLVTVRFSNGLTASANAVLQADGTTVIANAQVAGSLTPGNGFGDDGIHIAASGNSTTNTSLIQNNTVTGMGGYGIHVETSGNASAPNVVIQNNTLKDNGSGVIAGTAVYTGGGVDVTRGDSSTLNVLLANNLIAENFNNGVTIATSGTATGGLVVNSRDNVIDNDSTNPAINGGNAGNGIRISTTGATQLTFNSTRDNVSGNGVGTINNPDSTGGDNIAISTADTSVANVNLNNITANSAAGNGLSATTNDRSTLNLLISSPSDPLFTGTQSSFTNNVKSGIELNSNGTSYMHANVFNTNLNANTIDGIAYNRTGASLVASSITDTSMSNNQVNGLSFHGLGSDPQDPTQQFSGTANRINLVRDALNDNGSAGAGQGARLDLFGDSLLVLNATQTTFNHNAENGLRVELTPGASFGYMQGNQRSVFDNVNLNNNGTNGILITSDVAVSAPGNGILPFNPNSVTFFQISSNTGDTTINNNGQNGILMQYPGGNHDVLLTGANNPNFGVFIQGNTLNGISSIAGVEANPSISPGSGVVLSLNHVLVGGPTAAQANGLAGIDFESQSQFTVNNAATGPFTWSFNAGGFGTLNVNNSTIQGNGGDGIALIGNNLTSNTGNPATRFENFSGDASGRLSANITNSNIINNKGSGVNINLLGQMGDTFDFTRPRGVASNDFVFTNNNISSNGQYGVVLQQNTAVNIRGRGTVNDNFVTFNFNDPQPTNPPGTFNSNTLMNQILGNPVNNYDNFGNPANLADPFNQSNFMWLQTALNSSLVMTGNHVQFNGTQANLSTGDGVFLRVSTNSYLSADIRNNTLAGNLQNDFHVESFLAYNPVTNVAPQPTGSVARAAPALDTVVMDDTAQLDLRFTGNVGNTINIVSPTVNFFTPPLNPSTIPNGAAYLPDPLKGEPFSFQNPSFRIVQVFQIDDGNNLNTTNSFTQNGVATDIVTEFSNADWALRTTADPAFPNPTFPQSYFQTAGDPFLP